VGRLAEVGPLNPNRTPRAVAQLVNTENCKYCESICDLRSFSQHNAAPGMGQQCALASFTAQLRKRPLHCVLADSDALLVRVVWGDRMLDELDGRGKQVAEHLGPRVSGSRPASSVSFCWLTIWFVALRLAIIALIGSNCS
jgi:hypothetical protein